MSRGILKACEKFCPDAVVGVIVHLVDSMVRAMCEHYKKLGLDRKIVGVTTLHFSQCLVGSSSPGIRWRIWTKVCKIKAPNWSWRKLQPGWQLRALRVRTRSVSVTTLLKCCTHSVECDIIDQT